MTKKKKKTYKALRIFGKILLGLFILIVLLLLFVRSPWGQDIIVQQLVNSLSEKTGTKITVKKAYLSFDGDVAVEGLYLEDLSGDTLVFSTNLEADIALWPIVMGNAVSINSLTWKGLTANVVREDTLHGFNYQFLIDTFASTNSSPAPKDTTAVKFDLGELHFRDFDVSYQDAVSGTYARAKFQEFDLNMRKFDLQKTKFHVKSVNLSGAHILFSQTKPVSKNESPSPTEMPVFSIDQLKLTQVKAEYRSKPEALIAKTRIATLELELPMANFSEKKLLLDRLLLKNSGFLVKIQIEKGMEQNTMPENNPDFQWPDWEVAVNEISLSGNEISYFVNGQRPTKNTINPDAIALNGFNLQLNDLALKDNALKADLKNLSFTGESGIRLKKLAFDAVLGRNRSSLENLQFRFNHNSLTGKLSANYSSIASFLKNPKNARLNINLPQLKVALEDVFVVMPKLKNNEYLLALSKKRFHGKLKAQGTFSAVNIPIFELNWGKNTSISATGSLKNIANVENLQFDFPRFHLFSTKKDIVKFIEEDSLGISIPKEIELRSSFHGGPQNITATAELFLPDGKIELNGRFNNKNQLAFDLGLEAKKINLGKLLQNDQLDQVSFTIKTNGQGENLNTLDANLNAKIADFSYGEYAFENIQIDGKIENGSGNAFLNYKDHNLDMELKTVVDLDTVSPVFGAHLNLKGADLQALGITARDIRTTFVLDTYYEGNAQGYNIALTTQQGVLVYDDESYLMGNIEARAHISPDTTSVNISNKILDLKLRSNTDPAEFLTALQQHLRGYISEKMEIPDTVPDPVQLQMSAKLTAAPILKEVLLPKLRRLDTVNIDMDFDQRRRKLDVSAHIPYVNYDDKEIDSMQIAIHSDKTNFEGSLAFDQINAGPVSVNKTKWTANLANDRLYMNFESYEEDSDSLLVHVQTVLNAENDSLYFHIDPTELLLKGKKWNISASNRLILTENFIGAENFRLSRNDHLLHIAANSDPKKNELSVGFENFPLSAMIGFLNPENQLATGKLNGNLAIENPFGDTGIIADLAIQNFSALNVPMGRLSLQANALGGKSYNFDLGLSQGDLLLDLTGNYVADSTAAKLDMELDVEKLKLDALKNFTNGAITNTKGFISGNLQIQGTTNKPVYHGNFSFHETVFDVSTLGATFKINEESIHVETDEIHLDNFTIEDKNENKLVVNGSVFTKNMLNPAFDLDFQAQNFEALNSTIDDNELYYGRFVFDLEATLTGNMNLPVVNAQLNISPETNFTYVLPASEVAKVSREGIVEFVNKEYPENILTRNSEEETTIVTGIIVNSLVNIGKGAVFRLIIDKKNGDNLQVAGEGSLNFDISASGNTHLAGRYKINDGHYLLSLYGLVKRRFDIMDGSDIFWYGDPLEASLDITAKHLVETSAAPLMAAQTSGTIATRFRQELGFLVYLYVDGWLLRPKLSFGIGMEEEDKGSLGGQVVGTLQQINDQESQLNKQVFSLLVLGSFYPQGNNYGAQGGALTLARDNLNQLLSDQLNMFSDRFLGDTGINLNFGLDSYTDYRGTSPQERTALEISAEKHFLDDRLVVAVGSAVDIVGGSPNQPGSDAVIENASIVYLLTENGRWRIKGFRKNTFENVIDGQVVVNGIALIFQRQFNKFEELFKNELEKMQKKKENKKNDQNR